MTKVPLVFFLHLSLSPLRCNATHMLTGLLGAIQRGCPILAAESHHASVVFPNIHSVFAFQGRILEPCHINTELV